MSEHILLHVCCGPCAIIPVIRLREQGHKVTALFVNPNIHPLSEYLRRRDALIMCAEKLDFDILWRDDMWNIQRWLQDVAGTRDSGAARCEYCYNSRLDACAQMLRASQNEGFAGQSTLKIQSPFTAFSSSLLYSRYQNHAQIKACAEKAAADYGVAFYYDDFREDWQKGVDLAKEYDLYRQAYCGCVYSEAERYAKKLSRLQNAVMV